MRTLFVTVWRFTAAVAVLAWMLLMLVGFSTSTHIAACGGANTSAYSAATLLGD